jgi:hypothetical protein
LCRLELNCRTAELSIRDGKLPPAELRAERSLIAQWTCQRDRLLGELLGNGKAVGSPWDALDAERHQDGPAATPPALDATAATVGDGEADQDATEAIEDHLSFGGQA